MKRSYREMIKLAIYIEQYSNETITLNEFNQKTNETTRNLKEIRDESLHLKTIAHQSCIDSISHYISAINYFIKVCEYSASLNFQNAMENLDLAFIEINEGDASSPSPPVEKVKQTFKVKVITYGPHQGGILVENSSGGVVYRKEFEGEDIGRVESAYGIQASIGDTVTVEVLSLSYYINIELVKEGLLFDKTLCSVFEYERAILKYTIKETD